jgi:hypothetical protein
LLNCPNCPEINTANFNNIKLNDALASIEPLYNESGEDDYIQALYSFHEILTYSLEDTDHNVNYLKAYGFNQMKTVYQKAVSVGQINTSYEANYPNITEYADLLKLTIEHLAVVDGDPEKTYTEKVYYETEEAVLLRSLNRRDLALNLLNEINSYADELVKPYIEKLICSFGAEKNLLDETISYEEYVLETEACNTIEGLEPGYVEAVLPQEETTESNIEYNIYPNPSEGNFNLYSENFSDNELDVIVYNSSNQIIFEQVYYSSGSVIDETINLIGFTSGIYNIHLISSTSYQVEQLIVN